MNTSIVYFSRFKLFGWIFSKFSLMDRYIAKELVVPFLFGLGAFSTIALVIGSIFDLVQKVAESGLPILIAIKVFLLQMPRFIVLAFPMSTLMTTLIVYSRLSSDREITALQGCGTSIYRIVMPAIVLSLVVTGTAFFFNEFVVPPTNYQASEILEQALKKPKVAFQETNIFYREFKDEQLSHIFYARHFDGQRMRDLMILDFSRGSIHQIVASESAVWNETSKTWNLFKGTLYDVADDGSYNNTLIFERYPLRLSRAPLDLAIQNRQSDQMNISEVQQYLKLLEQSGDQNRIRKLRIRLQEKFALPFVCVVFGLAGTSLGITAHRNRTSATTGFGISVIIIFSYYLLSFISSSLGEVGIFSPLMAAWLPATLGLGVGGVILSRAAQ
ncbi:MAG TPA: LptF/LptG family permease [Candidatus Caenarcaniphilales bacterium]